MAAANLNSPLLEEGKAPVRPQSAAEQQFRRRQSDLVVRLSSTAFPRTTRILALFGVFLICLTLFKIPKIDGGVPLPLAHEILISFAVHIALGILLNLFVFLMHLLALINERKLNKTEPPPSLKLIEKCFNRQKKLIKAIHFTESFISVFGSSFWVYVFVVGVFGTFLPYSDASSYTGIIWRLIQTANYLWLLLRILIKGFPKEWGLD